MLGYVMSMMRRWRHDTGGNIAIMTAISAPPIIIMIAALTTYSNTVTTKMETQAAVDAAALAASTAYANGSATSAGLAETVAANVFKANAPAQAISGQTCLNITTTPPGPGSGTVTTSVQYCGKTSNMFDTALGGSGSSFSASAISSANIISSQSGAGSYNGYGESWGDPHMQGEDGADFYYVCTYGQFSNVLSDYGIQINGLCEPWGGGGAYAFTDVAMVLGGHQVYFSSGYNTNQSNGTWVGTTTVDGVTTTPTGVGTTYPLTDTTQGIQVAIVMNAGNFGVEDGWNWATVTTPEYSVQLWWNNYDTVSIEVTMTNAGACGLPGGTLGQTWGPTANVDTNGSDFVVSGPYWTGTQYSSNACGTAAKTKTVSQATLIQ